VNISKSKQNASYGNTLKAVAVMVTLALLLPLLPFFGQQTQARANSNVVVLTYDEALQMALRDLLPVIDAETLIERAQDRRNVLEEELEQLEQGWWMNESVIAIHDELWRLDWQLQNAEITQAQLQESIDLILMEIFANLPLLGVDGVAVALSHAFQLAIHGVIGVQGLSNEITLLELRRLNLLDALWDVNSEDMITGITEDITNVDRQIQDLRLQQERLKQVRELSLRRVLIDLCDATSSMYIAQTHLALLENNLRRANIRYELGMSSVSEVRILERNLAQARLDLEVLRVSRDVAQENLNHLLGVSRLQLTSVEFDRELHIVPTDVERFIEDTVLLSPSIRQLQLVVDEAEDARQSYIGDDEGILRTLNEAYERAVLVRSQAIASMEALMHNAFGMSTLFRTKF